jgi:hypothetical protein
MLTIRMKKNPDGETSLTCTRGDGTVTWQPADELFAGWDAVPPGESLELLYE